MSNWTIKRVSLLAVLGAVLLGSTASSAAAVDYRYAATLPGFSNEFPQGVAVGPNDDVFVANAVGDIHHFSKTGKALGSWNVDVAFPDVLFGIAIYRHELYAAAGAKVERFSLGGKLQRSWTLPNCVVSVAVQSTNFGYATVAFGDKPGVYRFDNKGGITPFPFSNGAPDAFPGLAVAGDQAHRVYVPASDRVHVYGANGSLIGDIVPAPSRGPSTLMVALAISPASVYASSYVGNLFGVDANARYFFAFDLRTNTQIGHWGSFGSGSDQFDEPEAIAADSRGNVYVADPGNRRVVKWSPS